MAQDNKHRIYDVLTQKTGYKDSYDDFDKAITGNENARKKVYEVLRDKTGLKDSYDDFVSAIGINSTPNESQSNQEINPSAPVQDFQPRQEVKDYVLDNIPGMFKSKGNNLSTRPLQTQEDFSGDSSDFMQRLVTDENQRIEQAERVANDPYMRQQELEHVFRPKNQEQINTVKGLINTARMERARERQKKAASVGDGGLFSTLSQAYVAGEMNDTDKQLEYAATLIEQAQNITDEAKKKGNTNFFSGFARGFRDAPLDGWAMGLQDLKNYAAAKKVMDKVDKGEKLNPAEDALMQALVTNAATQMYYAGDLGRGYKAGGVTAESLPFMLDMIAGMGTVQALTKPASKALVKYATEKAAQYGLKRAGTGLVKGAARTVAGLGDVAAHTATFGSQRVAADYQRRGLGDIQVKPNEDGTVSYDGRQNIQTGGEALGKSIVSTAAETGSELLGEYFGPMLGWIGRATGANRIGKIIPASVGKAYSSLVNSQGFKQVQEIARRAKIADPIGEYGEEVVNNLISTAIGDMTPEQLVDLDQNIDTFLGVAPMSALFGAAGTAGYLRGQYRNYRNMRQFENRMQEEMGEDWSGVREALQDADIETAREMVKDVLSSDMTPQMKKDAITYISSVLQELTLQNVDKQSMPEDIAQAKRDIFTNLSNTRRQIPLSDEQLNEVISRVESQGKSALEEMGFTPEQQDMIMSYNDAYQDYNNYTFWVQDMAQNARRQAEQQVESLTNATTGTVMRVKAGFSQEPVNILRGNVVFDAEGKVDREKSDNVVYYLDKDGKVQMSSIDAIESVIDDSPAEEVVEQAGNDAENEVLQSEEAQINPPIELGTVFRNNGQNLIVARKTPQGYEIAAVDDNGELIPEVGTQEVSEEDLRNAIAQSSTEGQITNNTETAPEQPVSTETQPESPSQGESSETSQEQEPQTALSRIPTNEKGEQDFESAPAEDTGAALMEISEGDIDDAKDTADQMILSYQEQLKKADKMKTTGASIQEIVKLKQEKKEAIRQINDKIRYWQSVSDAIEKRRPGGIMAEAKKASDENQQRLASMTPQEQSEAQAKVQENIDKGVYDRPSQKRTKTRYVKEDNELGQANTPMEHVLREIATGRVSFLWNDNGPTQGLGRHLGYSDSSTERKRLIWAFSNESGMTPEAASEAIHADMPENLQGMVTDQDIFNMIVQAFQEYGSPSKMWKAAKEMHGTDEIESMPGYRQDIERQALEWEASENNMTVQEWISYCDFIEEELDNMFSSVSDEELNTIFEQINDDYERRNETESAGSAQGQADSKQSDEILPSSESDNTGTGEESREQPERTAETDGEGDGVVPEQKPAEEDELKNEKKISGRIQETENEWEEEGEYGTKYFRTILVDGTRNVTQVDEPDEKGNYTGSYFLYDNNRFPGIPEIIDYIDSPSSDTKIEKARSEVDQNPTEAQKEAGNYRKGHVKIDGFNVTIENPKGSVRSGKDADGNEWSVTMNNDYGYIRGTEGVDGDHIDVFLSDNPEAGDVFVIDQVDSDGSFDEHKVMYGFKSALAAKRAYLANYSAGWNGLGNITRVTKEEFRKWIDSSNRKTKPFAEYKSVKQAASTEEGQNRIVSSARYEELKKRMREKLNQLNAGIDPEIIAIGAEMAVYHIERGAIKFADYAKAMVSDLGDVIRPYLKSFYNAVRDMPQAEENGLVENMTPYEEVRAFDVTNFDRKTPDVMQQIQNVAKEKEIEKVAEESRKKPGDAKLQEVDLEGLFESLKKEGEARLSDHIKKPESELSGDSAQYQVKQIQEREAVNNIGTAIWEKALKSVDGIDSSPLTMKDVKNILKEYSMLADMSATDMQELVELAMTNETRKVALRYINRDNQKFGYDIILAMYNMQPLLNARDSTRFEKQQYSTPTPFGYVMGQFVQASKQVESVLEPSAGNGALTITFPSGIVHVNDIDERRLDNLRTLGYKEVTNRDALLPFDESVDAVMTNPPFGTTTAKEFDGGLFKISSLEGLMAINALDSMKDNGRAAIVIGGNTSYRENGAMQSKDMKLFSYLYSHYNVVDVINLDGEMYKRNGTKYDVRIILINGRKTGPFKRTAPPVKSKARAEQVKTFDELYKRIQDDIQSLQQMGDLFDGTAGETRRTEDGRRSENRLVSDRKQPGERTEPVRNPEGIRTDTGRDTMGNAGNEQPGRTTEERTTDGMDNAVRPDAGSTQPVQEQQRPDGGTDTGRGSSDGSVQSDSGNNTSGGRLSVNLGDEKVPYPNRSQSGTLMSVVPANQAQVLADSLADIGDVDQFLVDELGYSSKDELYSYLAAEQIDSVSLAINQMNKGNGFIIGDMTGVGKGRQGAALIRYAVRKGYKPIYFTQKPALFADNYRDLSDIGSGELRPFIIASSNDGQITDAQGNVVHKIPSKKEVKRVYDYIKENGTLPDEYDYAIITYSQIQNGTSEYEASTDGIKVKSKNYKKSVPAADISGQERRDVIQTLSRNNVMILDESHTVGGSGGGSMFMQYILPDVKGVTFLSATFAKRADNMPIYAMKTDLSKSGISPQEMIEAIANGGVTLQEIMSKQLVQSGQMIRRERSFQGVTIDWLPVNEEEDAVQRTQFDEVSSIFSDIRAFQKDFITPMVSNISDELAEEGGYSDLQKGTKELGVTNVPFASKMYNLVNQLLFSLKADAVANRVIWNLKNGFKPVISFTNTMEGFLDEAPKDTPMEKVPNFSLTLMKALDGVMRYSVNDIEGKSEANQFSVSDLSEAGQKRYNEIKEKIQNLSASLPISPMDAIKMKIEEAGYKVGEITGRNLEMVRDENGMYVIRNRKDTDKKAAARDFNNGNLDVLMINKSGSTGISLHASPKFEDQRQRVMVFAQFQSDINDEVQMRGRIDRTGQKFRGKYEYIMSSIPAEQRLQMMFKAKLKSLDANTTSSQKSKFNEMQVVDFLNKYGDEVVFQYMLEHPELSEKLGDPLGLLKDNEAGEGNVDNSKRNDCAAKIARYLPFLPVREQEEVFKDITEAYSVKMQLLNDAGENDLEITTMPLRAETKSKKIWKKGTDPESGNAFADNTYLEEVEVDVLKKPMKAEEIRTVSDRMTDGKPFDEWKEEKVSEINSVYDGKIQTLKERLSSSAEERAQKAKEKYINSAKKAREKGNNEFTDEEIETMSQVAYDEVIKSADESLSKQTGVIERRRENMLKVIEAFTPMKPLVVPFDLTEETATLIPSIGTFVGFKFSKDFSPSSSTAVFSVLDGRRKVEIPFTQEKAFSNIRMNTMMQPTLLKDVNMENWDSRAPKKTRRKAYIVTGNLLQALVDTQKSFMRGCLVSYSTMDGDTRQGILMSDNFKPDDLKSSAPFNTKISAVRSGEPVTSEDKRVTVEKNTGWRTGYSLKVPKSRKTGGEFFEDKKLRSLVSRNEFETKGAYMVANFDEENLEKVMKRLSDMGVTVSQKAKLENSEGVRYREGESSSKRSIVDRQINELAKNYLNEDLSRYPYEDRRTDKDRQGEVYYGYSEPMFKEEKLMDSEFVPEVIKDIVRNDEYEIDAEDITGTLQDYIESEGGPQDEFARPFVDALEWFMENQKDIRMSDKVNLIVDSPDIRWRFIGEKGASNLDAYEEANTRLDNLSVARNMEDAGKDAKSIKTATGWERGSDGKWRYEVYDGESVFKGDYKDVDITEERRNVKYRLNEINGEIQNARKEKDSKKLDSLLEEDDKLRTRLANLKALDFVTSSLPLGTRSEQMSLRYVLDNDTFNSLTNAYPELNDVKVTMTVTSELNDTSGAYNSKDKEISLSVNENSNLHSTLMHEIQHAIQDIEGFSKGGNIQSAVLSQMKGVKEKMEKYSRIYDEYMMNREYDSDDYREVMRHLQIAEEIKKENSEAIDEYEKLKEEYENLELRLIQGSFNEQNFNDYRRISGEVEARNVQNRLDMDDVQRRNTLASETEDVSREDQIFLMDNLDTSNLDSKGISSDISKTAESLHVPVEVITSSDQINDESVRKAIESGRKIKGWYSLSDRKVYVYLPNTSSVEDARQTILHEGVAHFGLRKLVGDENMDAFLDEVFANVTKEVREKIISTLPRYGWDSRVATEEYMASMAENGVDVTVWQRIKQAFKNLLRKIGIRMEINDKELRYILWRSRQNLESGNVLDMAKDIAMQYEMGVGNYYREESPSDGSREKYEESLKGWRYKATEAYQDSMLSLKNLQDIIAEVSGKPIKSFENAYMAENQLSSKNTAEAEKYYKNDFVPMLEAAGKIMKKYGLTQKAIERYMMLAHGIERNVEMSIREQANEIMKDNPDDAQRFVDDFRAQRDSLRQKYSGYEYLKELSELTEGIGDFSATQAILESMDGNEHADFQNDALEQVRQFEDMYDVKELWEKTNKATKDTLRKTYESGMMGRKQFDNVSDMFMYYVPLRGWSEKTAEDVYEYISSERNPVNSVLRSMKGRKSIPDEVFATIGNMAESAILQGNRNMMKQNFMSMVMNHPTDLATMRKTWYVYDNNTGEWHISTPEIEEKDTAAIIEKKISDHEERMKQLEEKGLATQTSSGLNIDYRIQPKSAKEHVVQVKNGGKDYTIYVNANPRAAQAINGITNPDVEKNPIFKAISTANRWLAANFTTRNPAFVLSNLSRDLIFSMSAVYIKEDGKYSARYRKNLLKTPSAVFRNIRGKGNPNTNEIDRYFQEFIENGGETGYMHLNDVDKYKKKVRAELAKIDGSRGSAKAALDYTLERLEDFNRWAEDISRFTVYMTSRQMGRTVQESVNDAKEITVNFNKKGAGYKTSGFFGLTAGMMRNLYLFFNASVQSLTNFKRLAVRNKTKFFSILGGFSAAGMLMPIINSFLYNLWDGGDDDPYNDLPEWVRRNNLCIYAGNGKFVTIPLPIELRAFYGIGDMAYQFATGKEKATPTNVVKSTVNQLAELLPLNPTGNEGLKTFMPDALAPIFEAYVWNEDFTGKPVAKITPFNERDPEWKRVYKGTSGWLVDTSKFLNDLSNGSGPGKEFRKGFLDFNPAKVEHLLESYFGGMAKTLNQAGKTIYYGSKSIIEGESDEDLTMRNTPILNRFINKIDDRNAFSGINREYFNLKDEMEQFKYELNGVKKNYRKNPEEYKEMVSSDDFRRYVKYRPYEKRLSRLNQIAKETEGEERERIEEMIIETRREAINAVK